VWECGSVGVWECGSVERWKGGKVERWKGGKVENLTFFVTFPELAYLLVVECVAVRAHPRTKMMQSTSTNQIKYMI
jgi:hypothetical protein